MTNPEEHPQGDETKIPTPGDIASLCILPGKGQEPPARDETARGHDPKANDWDLVLKFASESHDYNREYIRNADQKAIFYFSVCSVFLAFEHSQSWAQRWIKDPGSWSITDGVSFVAMVCLALGAGFFLSVVFPRLGGTPRSLIFFKSVASFPNGDEFASNVIKQTQGDMASEKLLHCYQLAKIASSKYKFLSIGLWIGCLGILCSLLMLVSIGPRQSNEVIVQKDSVVRGH